MVCSINGTSSRFLARTLAATPADYCCYEYQWQLQGKFAGATLLTVQL